MQRQQTELTELNAKNNDLRQQMEHQATELAQLKEQLVLVKALLSRSDDLQRAALELKE